MVVWHSVQSVGKPGGDVRGIGGSGEVRLMAAIAGGGQCGVVVVDVAGVRRARWCARRSAERLCVLWSKVASSTTTSCGRWRRWLGSPRSVVRVRGSVVIRLVAAIAVSGQGRVVVIRVAVRAGHGDVRAGQREGRVRCG